MGGCQPQPGRTHQTGHQCLTLQADALFELTDAVLCTDGSVVSLPELSIAEVHRRGHGAMYDVLAQGHIAVSRLRMARAGLVLPRGADGQLSIALGGTASGRRVFAPAAVLPPSVPLRRGASDHPGWPYQVAAALGGGRSSWTGPLDVMRLGPEDDPTEVTAAQIRDLVARLERAGQWRLGDLPVLFVLDSGYDIVRLTRLLRKELVRLLGRIRAERVMRAPAGKRRGTHPGRPPRHGAEFRLADPAATRRRPASTTASARPSPAAGATCTPSWTGAAHGPTMKANSPSSRERWSIWRSSTCPATATPSRCGCGTAPPTPPRMTKTASLLH
ncbi:transposase [Streptomyces laculatispora]|uniref:transposase n=1 Tax=Streptomyces laculatispora TaxID=887464 RepID=UPI0035568885